MELEPVDWGDSGTGLPDFSAQDFIVELEGQPTPEGIALRLAQTQSKKNQLVVKLQHIVVDIEYKQALAKIEKAKALQSATGTVQQRESYAEAAIESSTIEVAKIKGKVKVLNIALDNLHSAQIALTIQTKTLSLQNDMIRD